MNPTYKILTFLAAFLLPLFIMLFVKLSSPLAWSELERMGTALAGLTCVFLAMLHPAVSDDV